MASNFGDVALRLPENWDRLSYADQDFGFLTVGHTRGVADLHRKDDAEKAHQFYWCDITNVAELNRLQSRGFKFVTKDEWNKVDGLWGDWNAAGFVEVLGLRAMARPGERFFADESRRGEMKTKVGKDHDRELDKAPDGSVALDDAGHQVKRGPGRPRTRV